MKLLIALFLSYGVYVLVGPAGFTLHGDILSYRIVRGLYAMIAGSALSLSGLMLQALFSNPLVEPYILGVSSSATTGSLIAIFFLGIVSAPLISGFSFFFSILMVVVLVFFLKKYFPSREALLLVGISAGSTLTAINSIIMLIKSRQPSSDLLFWLLGSLSGVGKRELLLIFLLLPLFVVSLFMHRELDLLLWGDEAFAMGLNQKKVYAEVLIISTALAATVVSLTGVIGFVGLISPHIGRRIFGWSHKKLIPASMLIGALVLLLSDFVARNLLSPTEIPVGLITSLIGAPLFLYLVMKRNDF
ncbi:MAG: iron ABC transporter permease [Candidatus Aminicenantes bacterium]|nr:iron ABC transporter permease [Candidatus Aminicenantes bacterium]